MKSTFILSIFSHSCDLAILAYIAGTSTDFSSSNTMEVKPYSGNAMEVKSKSSTLQSTEDMGGESKSFGYEASIAETEDEKPPITGN